MQNTPPLLLFAKLKHSFELTDIEFGNAGDSPVHINQEARSNFENVEVVFKGLTFKLTLFTHDDLKDTQGFGDFSTLECNKPEPESTAIGVALGEHIAAGYNVPLVNASLLEFGRLIGDYINATHAAWLPARQFVSFEYYGEAVQHYLDGGPLPALVQIRIEKDDTGGFATTGLGYFAGQELLVTAHPTLPDNKLVQRLIRIARDIAVNGPIETAQTIRGMEEGETMQLQPSKDGKAVRATVDFQNSSAPN